MGYKSAKSARDSYSLKLKKLGVERVGTRAKPVTKTSKTPKAPPKSKPTKDGAPRKPRVRKPAAKKAEAQEGGPEKVAEEA